jgi:hypothetical protein
MPTTLTGKGQATIPKPIGEALQLELGAGPSGLLHAHPTARETFRR